VLACKKRLIDLNSWERKLELLQVSMQQYKVEIPALPPSRDIKLNSDVIDKIQSQIDPLIEELKVHDGVIQVSLREINELIEKQTVLDICEKKLSDILGSNSNAHGLYYFPLLFSYFVGFLLFVSFFLAHKD